MKKLLYFLFFVSCLLDATGQQLPLFNQYREHQTLINPAATSIEYLGYEFQPNSTAGISYRYQWTGLKSGPRTMTARYEHIADDHNMIFGGAFLRDKTGPTSVTGGYFRYGYMINLEVQSTLTIGLSAGILQHQFRGDEDLLRDKDDVLGSMHVNTMYFDYTLGAFFQTEVFDKDNFYIGVTVPQSVTPSLGSNEINFELHRNPHFYIHTGLNKQLDNIWHSLVGDATIYLEPSLWFKYVKNAPSQLDMNLRVQMANAFWIGTGYSIAFFDGVQSNNLHLEVGMNAFTTDGNLFKIGYGFDRSLNTFGPIFGNVHEINLSYSFLRY